MKTAHIVASIILTTTAVTALNGAPVIVPSTSRGTTNDAFSPPGSITILGASALNPNSGGVLNIFGGTGGVEGDDTIFADAPIGSTYYVDFSTSSPVSLFSYGLYLSEDTYTGNRSISDFQLYYSSDATFTTTTLISDVTLGTPYASAYGGADNITVYDQFAPVNAQFFRMEFVNATTYGPRIVELDGNVVPTPEPSAIALSCVGLMTIIVLGIRKRKMA